MRVGSLFSGVGGFDLGLEGLRPGVADLAFMGWCNSPRRDGTMIPFTGFIELKTRQGRQSPRQKEFRADCQEQWIPYQICRSLEEVEATLQTWGLV